MIVSSSLNKWSGFFCCQGEFVVSVPQAVDIQEWIWHPAQLHAGISQMHTFSEWMLTVYTWFQALEKAKDAGRKERVLVRQREQVTTPENINLDLTYSVSMKYLLSKIILAKICRFQKSFILYISCFLLFLKFYWILDA